MTDAIPNAPRLELHIPHPPTRAEGRFSFDGLNPGTAGAVGRPDPLVGEEQIRDMPFAFIRVLDDDGNACGPWKPGIAAETLLRGLRAMLLTRLFDDRLFRAHRQGKTSFYMKSVGEEAISVAQSLLLTKGDMCFPTYRMMGWLHARNYPLLDLVNQIFSNEADPLKGRQLPILLSARDYDFYSLAGNLGSRLGHAVGWAMASAYKSDTRIALGHIGEGSTAEGAFHEALTFASVYHAPCILCIDNNQWAISSYSGVAGAEEAPFAAKALAYGIPGLRVDGNDFLAVWAATEWAMERARANHGTTLIEFFTYRAEGHSTSDDPGRYRAADEGRYWPLGDPIERLKQHLIGLGEWSEEQHSALTVQLSGEVKDAVRQGEAIGTLGASKPSVREMFEDVFKEPDWRVIEQRREAGV